MSGSGAQGYFGQQGTFDASHIHSIIQFYIKQELGNTRTSVPVKVIAVHGGGVGAPPTVDVQVMTKQSDGVGNTSSHSTIYGIPVARNQGGANAIINDPVVGDYGHMVVSDRDISSVKKNGGAESNPGSYRRHDLADGVYHAAILNTGNPSQYIQFTSGGVRIFDKNGSTVIESKSDRIIVNPASSAITIYLGGDGSTGTYAVISTVSGPALPNIKARIA